VTSALARWIDTVLPRVAGSFVLVTGNADTAAPLEACVGAEGVEPAAGHPLTLDGTLAAHGATPLERMWRLVSHPGLVGWWTQNLDWEWASGIAKEGAAGDEAAEVRLPSLVARARDRLHPLPIGVDFHSPFLDAVPHPSWWRRQVRSWGRLPMAIWSCAQGATPGHANGVDDVAAALPHAQEAGMLRTACGGDAAFAGRIPLAVVTFTASAARPERLAAHASLRPLPADSVVQWWQERRRQAPPGQPSDGGDHETDVTTLQAALGAEWRLGTPAAVFVPWMERAALAEFVSRFAFVVCARGRGVDTHRAWEALVMGHAVVLTRHSGMEQLLDGLPAVFVTSWQEVTPQAMLEWHRDLSRRWHAMAWHKLSSRWWIDQWAAAAATWAAPGHAAGAR
jgi:hypothetical protein